MKTTFAVSAALALMTSMVSAAPNPPTAELSPPYQIAVNFIGAANARFTQYFNTNGFGSTICMLFLQSSPVHSSHLQKEALHIRFSFRGDTY